MISLTTPQAAASAIAIGGAGVLTAAYWLPALPIVRDFVEPDLGISRRLSDRDGVALTFDDGPHPDGTPAILELLDVAGAKATFFLVGEQVERYPSLAAEIAAAGHGIGLHCHRHRTQLWLAPGQVRADLERAATVIGEATGRSATLHRPPRGRYTIASLTIVRRRGWQPLLWSQDTRDWEEGATPTSILTRLDRLSGGDVVLMHDADHYGTPRSWQRTAAALPRVLERLGLQGLEPVLP